MEAERRGRRLSKLFFRRHIIGSMKSNEGRPWLEHNGGTLDGVLSNADLSSSPEFLCCYDNNNVSTVAMSSACHHCHIQFSASGCQHRHHLFWSRFAPYITLMWREDISSTGISFNYKLCLTFIVSIPMGNCIMAIPSCVMRCGNNMTLECSRVAPIQGVLGQLSDHSQAPSVP